MSIRSVIFDIGGVLERVADPDAELGAKWRDRLGMDQAAFTEAMRRVDPDLQAQIGEMSEATYRERCALALDLSPAQADEFMADMWDWYCGELARREEIARYAFDTIFDPIIYSHEVGLAKPDPAIFELACARMDLEPAQAIFVDDVPGRIAAARALGHARDRARDQPSDHSRGERGHRRLIGRWRNR